jgi:Sulfotransferase domain
MPQNRLLTSIWHSPSVTNIRHAASPARLLRHVNARHRRLPDYIIAGAQKAGTTSLYAYLSEHPNVDPPITKEIRYFDRFHDRGINWYRMHFPLARARVSFDDAGVTTLTGESTPNYLFYPPSPERIARTLSGVKVILLLRNPVDRAFSHYQLKLKRRQEPRSFDEAVDAEIERLQADREQIAANPDYYIQMHDRFTYLARGRYVEQIHRWQSFFAPWQLLLVESGRFFKHTGEVFERVCDFLGLPRWQPAQFGNRYPGRYKDKMSDATRRKLVDYFAPHNARLYAHLAMRFDWDR